MGVLTDILAEKAANLRELATRKLPSPPPRRPVALARRAGDPLRLIAEIKFRSPSAGALSSALGVAERARAYERAGASMVSVLTDARFFGGAWENIATARAATALPVLCKEFVIDELQLDAARSYGADAVLVIVRCVAKERVRALVDGARARELEPFVEIANDEEASVALDAGATLVGVNARDLDTLVMDAERAARTLAALPSGVTRVHLSGLAKPGDVERVRNTPADAALVGETLMRADDPEPLLRSLVAAAKP
ncbi:MAG TPA: indole-3-glycerol-phosphate synthase [Polyangiaceae bacterium]